MAAVYMHGRARRFIRGGSREVPGSHRLDFANGSTIFTIPCVTDWHPRLLKAYERLDGLFFNEFLKHVPIIHRVLGRQQIAEDDQLAAIACALGSLAADDAPPGYMCAVWMQTYKRLSGKVVRPPEIVLYRSLTVLQKAGVIGCTPDSLLEFCFLHAIQIFRSHPNSMLVTTRKVIDVRFDIVRHSDWFRANFLRRSGGIP
jgi:hypothetical protein